MRRLTKRIGLTAVLLIVLLFCLKAFSYLTKPLPPPNVSLKLQGFDGRGTNAYALLCLKNEGGRMIWPGGRGCVVTEIETNGGWMTNHWPIFTTCFLGIPSSSNEVMQAYLPPDFLRWRTTAYYHHYERHYLRLEMGSWLIKSGVLKWMPQPFFKTLLWCLSLLPEPKEESSTILTPFLTNKPPVF